MPSQYGKLPYFPRWQTVRLTLILYKYPGMRKCFYILFTLLLLTFYTGSKAQCSICTKTAQQLGEQPARALNLGIVYLAATPLIILGIIGFRWYKANKDMF